MPEEPEGPLDWKETGRSVLADCRVFTVERRRFLHPRRGQEEDFFVVCPSDWAVAMARTEDGRWVMVRQFRYGLGAATWEFPSGCREAQEDPVEAAVRELREETGYAGIDPIVLGRVVPNPAIQDNQCTFVLLRDAVCVGEPRWDEHEEMTIATMSDGDVRRAAVDGRMPHALMHAGLFLYDGWRGRT